MADTMIAAGPDLDAEIARRVFGFWLAINPTLPDYGESWWAKHSMNDGSWCHASVTLPRLMGSSVRYSDGLPMFSTDLAAAWAIVDELVQRGYRVDVSAWGKPGEPLSHQCRIRDDSGGVEMWKKGASAPEAICRAALEIIS